MMWSYDELPFTSTSSMPSLLAPIPGRVLERPGILSLPNHFVSYVHRPFPAASELRLKKVCLARVHFASRVCSTLRRGLNCGRTERRFGQSDRGRSNSQNCRRPSVQSILRRYVTFPAAGKNGPD